MSPFGLKSMLTCSNYGKLLRTTKKIIKLSDKNEDKLNELKVSSGKQRKTAKHSLNSQIPISTTYDSIFTGSRAGTRATDISDDIFSDLCGFTDFVETWNRGRCHVLNLCLGLQ